MLLRWLDIVESVKQYESLSETFTDKDDLTDREKRIGWMGFTVIVIILVFYYTIELIHFFHR